jgi:glycosyltransferase involved in cell wall biosynthesis
VPPVIETLEARGVRPDPATMERLRARSELNVLFVGRVAPNKAHERVIAVFERFHTVIEPRSRLHLVGDTADHPAYVARLRRLARRLPSGPAIEMPGKVPDEALAAYYRTADLFLCLSEHEGFGLPPLVAAAHGVPVLARAAAALGETVGDAGVLFDERADPDRVAELARVVLRDDEVRRSLARGAERRLQVMTRAAVQDAWAAVLAEVRT